MLELRRVSGMLPVGAGGNRPLLFVIASPSFSVIARHDSAEAISLAKFQIPKSNLQTLQNVRTEVQNDRANVKDLHFKLSL